MCNPKGTGLAMRMQDEGGVTARAHAPCVFMLPSGDTTVVLAEICCAGTLGTEVLTVSAKGKLRMLSIRLA